MAWIFYAECRKTKLLILADPPHPSKRVLWAPDGFAGCAFCILKRFAGRTIVHSSCFYARPFRVGVSAGRPLFFRTVSHSAVRTSNSPNPIEPTGVGRKKARVWPVVPLAILFLPSTLRLARAASCPRGNIHERRAKPTASRLPRSGAAHRFASRIGNFDSTALVRLVPRASRCSFYRSRLSSRTLPRRLGKMAKSPSGSSCIIDSAIPISCVRFQTRCDQR